MKFLLSTAVAAAALLAASPASAAACTGSVSPYQTDPEYTDCEAYAQINGGNAASVAAYNTGFDAVGYAGADLTWAVLEPTKDFFSILNGDQLVFDAALTGQQFFAIHFGSAGGGAGANNQTLFFQFNFADPTLVVDLNRLGFSNAIGVLSVPPPPSVPEPATWAMMLMGFGAAGFALRGSRRRKSELLQLA